MLSYLIVLIWGSFAARLLSLPFPVSFPLFFFIHKSIHTHTDIPTLFSMSTASYFIYEFKIIDYISPKVDNYEIFTISSNVPIEQVCM